MRDRYEIVANEVETKTLALSVENLPFMLERMGQDCGPLQFVRELMQNSIEAILRTPDTTGDVIWGVEWNMLELQDVFKLSITDSGDGMTGSEMEQYVNKLSSSFSEQSYEGNYGVGAKISTVTRNPQGMVYLSWKAGEGYYAHMWKDPDTGDYGLKQIERPDGSFGHWGRMSDDLKPPCIGEHGTMVVLLGVADDDNTIAAPDGAPSPSRWISKYLNARYFCPPSPRNHRARSRRMGEPARRSRSEPSPNDRGTERRSGSSR